MGNGVWAATVDGSGKSVGGGIGTQSASGSLGTAGTAGLSGGQNAGGATIVGTPAASDLDGTIPAGQDGASGSITFTQVPYVGVSRPRDRRPGRDFARTGRDHLHAHVMSPGE